MSHTKDNVVCLSIFLLARMNIVFDSSFHFVLLFFLKAWVLANVCLLNAFFFITSFVCNQIHFSKFYFFFFFTMVVVLIKKFNQLLQWMIWIFELKMLCLKQRCSIGMAPLIKLQIEACKVKVMHVYIVICWTKWFWPQSFLTWNHFK